MKDASKVAKLAIIVPCYNEEEALPNFIEAVIPPLEAATGGDWQIVFINDGSADRTGELIAKAHQRDERISGVMLSRNFGHQCALAGGLPFANAEYVGVLDCDLQDPISVLITLYETAKAESQDVCYGIRGKRDAAIPLRIGYWLFYRIAKLTVTHSWPLDAGDFCVMSRRAHKALLEMPEHSRMLRGMRSWIGLRQRGVSYDRPARQDGESKYSIKRLVTLAISGIVSFSTAPLQFSSLIGFVMAAASVLIGVLVFINRLFPRFAGLENYLGSDPGISTLILLLCFISSIGFICLGIVGEYLALVLFELKRRPAAVVQETIGISSRLPSNYDVLVAHQSK